MVGRPSFPFGARPIFRDELLVFGRVHIYYIYIYIFFWLKPGWKWAKVRLVQFGPFERTLWGTKLQPSRKLHSRFTPWHQVTVVLWTEIGCLGCRDRERCDDSRNSTNKNSFNIMWNTYWSSVLNIMCTHIWYTNGRIPGGNYITTFGPHWEC